MTLLLMFLLFCAYFHGAVTDYRRREIEDKVPIAIMAVSIIAMVILPKDSALYIPLIERIVMLAVFGIMAFLPNDIGGGDIKLLMATGFCFGFAGSLFIMLLSAIEAVILRFSKNMKNVPLAS
ncbi:MAG TPA: A24 family peptidase, partial [Anaerovoracaceae bacterium]|nr:A24 family peptidase [Anaerovoracaceae bacterium]